MPWPNQVDIRTVLTLGWAELVGAGLETYEVTGPHEAIMQEPHVQVLTEKLRACLSAQLTENGAED